MSVVSIRVSDYEWERHLGAHSHASLERHRAVLFVSDVASGGARRNNTKNPVEKILKISRQIFSVEEIPRILYKI